MEMEESGLHGQEVRLKIRQLGTPVNAVGVHNVVVLADEFNRELYIEIGPCEAMAILRGMDGTEVPAVSQPQAHDLLMTVCETLGAKVEKVVIDDLWNRTYYAKLHLRLDGETLTIDARPSDAIALALRADAPLYASEAVIIAAAESREEQ
jgi:bifunctional DNase/RNase